jgi:hypothetical protein
MLALQRSILDQVRHVFLRVLIKKDGRITQLTNFNFVDLRRVIVNGGFNVVILTENRAVFFHKVNQDRYAHYDLHILEVTIVYDRIRSP